MGAARSPPREPRRPLWLRGNREQECAAEQCRLLQERAPHLLALLGIGGKEAERQIAGRPFASDVVVQIGVQDLVFEVNLGAQGDQQNVLLGRRQPELDGKPSPGTVVAARADGCVAERVGST